MSKAPVFWGVGLSGAGKSTLFEAAATVLRAQGVDVLIVDGDDVREKLHRHLGFSPEDIEENNRLIVGLCERYRTSSQAILVPIISPFKRSREWARSKLSPHFYEVFVDAPLSVVMKRDIKGLYAKAKAGIISNMIGYADHVPFQPPEYPDLHLETTLTPASVLTDQLIAFVTAKLRGDAETTQSHDRN